MKVTIIDEGRTPITVDAAEVSATIGSWFSDDADGDAARETVAALQAAIIDGDTTEVARLSRRLGIEIV